MSSELVNITRTLNIRLPKGQSTFLWGPRKTGKTTYLVQHYPQSTRFDMLETDLLLKLSKEPHLFREEVISLKNTGGLVEPVIIDEVQKVPSLMDEIHLLIEKHKISFVLCGSSARKLKRTHANLLGGRAWKSEMFPLTTHELGGDFNLLKALNRGLIPSHYRDENSGRTLKAYINNYLKEEIRDEGLTRNLPAFARFLDAVPFSCGELVNYSNIASDCGVDAKTVAAYYQILVDTLIGVFVEPYRKNKKRKDLVQTPKFYLFDAGVAGGLMKRSLLTNKGTEFGRAFENFILMELLAHRSYTEKDYAISFWRTKGGSEVDFVLGNAEVAIEVKGTDRPRPADLKGLTLFKEEYRPKKAIVVCQEKAQRLTTEGIHIFPWQVFCKMLWAGDIV
ncbi:MAG: ATP-binding protein [Deltaproteobacteria bacterium]|nr:ATP-binding protein [Deltaproteobacteria bacterium]